MASTSPEEMRALVCAVIDEMMRREWEREHGSGRRSTSSQPQQSPVPLNGEEEAILDLVMEFGGASTGEIADELGWERPRVSKRCQRMQGRGLLKVAGHVTGNGVRTRQTVWVATPRGESSATAYNPAVWQEATTA